MKPPRLVDARRWLLQAQSDRQDGVLLREHGRHHLTCFLAQQSAEKALQAFLIAAGAERVWRHSAADICDEAAACVPALAGLGVAAALLDKFYVPTRYPDALPGGIPSRAYGAADSDQALSTVDRILAEAERALRSRRGRSAGLAGRMPYAGSRSAKVVKGLLSAA